MTFSNIVVGSILLLIQFLVSLPWLAVALGDGRSVREFYGSFLRGPAGELSRATANSRMLGIITTLGIVLLCLVAIPPAFLFVVDGREALEISGRFFAAAFQMQLVLDFFVVTIALLLTLWPKGGAVALAAFREGVRQPMYWLLASFALVLLTISLYIPYFTFGEDHIMYKELGYDVIMFTAVAFGALAASMFVSDEIEGRTALTLLSKPVSRREFLIGKYVGILLAALLMFGFLGCYFEGALLYKNFLDRVDPVAQPEWISVFISYGPAGPAADFLRGIGLWIQHTFETLPGLVLSFSQVMVLVSIAVTLATRVPMVVNLTTVLVIFFLSHLTPALIAIGRQAKALNPGPVAQLLGFVSQLFDLLLPDLEAFRIGPALLSDNPLPAGPFFQYLASVTLYGVIYSVIVLLLGLFLFEDRDLA
jgi:ABC-type transport system involved in multi-copper enzyme maturation permease subunit